jgi:hypothetical protein
VSRCGSSTCGRGWSMVICHPATRCGCCLPGQRRRRWSFRSGFSTASGTHVAEALPAAEGLPTDVDCRGSGPSPGIGGWPRCLARVAHDDGQVVDHMLPLTELDAALGGECDRGTAFGGPPPRGHTMGPERRDRPRPTQGGMRGRLQAPREVPRKPTITRRLRLAACCLRSCSDTVALHPCDKIHQRAGCLGRLPEHGWSNPAARPGRQPPPPRTG